jgi:hypothetical protein
MDHCVILVVSFGIYNKIMQLYSNCERTEIRAGVYDCSFQN